MKPLALTLLDGRSAQRLDDVTSLVAADASGQFGLQPGHAAFVTVLEPGLFRLRRLSRPDWIYAACTGGLLRCLDGEVQVVSSRFVMDDDAPEALQRRLDELLQGEAALRVSTREDQARLDTALLERLRKLAEQAA